MILSYPKTSLIEEVVARSLEEISIPFVRQFRIDNILVDFYLPEFEAVLEVNGCLYHACEQCNKNTLFIDTPENIRRKNEARYEQIKYHGYHLIILWEHEIRNKNIQETLLKILCNIDE